MSRFIIFYYQLQFYISEFRKLRNQYLRRQRLISIIQKMNKVLCLLLAFTLFTAVQTISCDDGYLPFDSKCLPISYIPGCSVYQADSTCKVCDFGYILNSNGKCDLNANQTRDCCASYGSDGTCQQCSNGLYWSDPYCFRNQIYGCILRKNNQCAVCGTGFVQANGGCVLQIPHCGGYSTSGVCYVCVQGYQLTPNFFCVASQGGIANCSTQNSYGCVQCNVGFYLTAARTCLAYEPGCLKYLKETCLVCHPNFYLNSNSKCVIDGCQKYNFDSCANCQDGLTLQNGKCSLNGCVRTANGNCVQCLDGLRLSAQGCVPPVNYSCQSCAAGFVFVNGGCIANIPGCSQYDTNNLCVSCTQPFQLTTNGLCQIIGCKSYCSDGCLACSPPFSLNGHICEIPNCAALSWSGCTSCNSGFLLVNGKCYQQDPNCLAYSTTSPPACTSCADRYYLLNGVCKPSSRGCAYDTQGNCVCKDGFKLSPSGTCDIIGCSSYNWQSCLTCSAPFTLNPNTQLCQIPNCLQYSWTGCAQCKAGWIAVQGVCSLVDAYCVSYDSQGVCQACQTGYSLDANNRCVRQIAYCQKLSQDKLSCVQCQQGYTLLSGACYLTIPNCNTMVLSNGNPLCSSCATGYRLNNGRCVASDPNCLKYTKNQFTQTCSQCANGYFIASDGSCGQKSFGCLYTGTVCTSCIAPFVYDSVNANCFIVGCSNYCNTGCTNCIQPFSLNNGTCVINYCVSYSKTACTACRDGFTLANNGLCVPNDPNCLVFSGSVCSQCKPGYQPCSSGFCVILDVYCKNYNNQGQCSSCADGYYLGRGGKCLAKENGCVYSNGVCSYCQPPFTFNATSKTCYIAGCRETNAQGCCKCVAPFTLTGDKTCSLNNCLRPSSSGCLQCSPQYHIKAGACVADDINCLSYAPEGLCQLCAEGYVVSSSGCCIPYSNSCLSYCSSDPTKCLQCSPQYFLNQFFQCEKRDGKCAEYTNGVCSRCSEKFFLYSEICFPYTIGCVAYSGKDCTQCKVGYTLKNGECFNFKAQGMALLGGDDHYNFDINPIDVRQSKYYINNLSPASSIGSYFFSSSFDSSYQNPSLSTLQGCGKGWKAQVADNNQYIGITITDTPVTFYAVQLEAVDASYITQFYIEYSVNGVDFIRVQNFFTVPASIAQNMTTIYFTGIYAQAIRIKISGYNKWPACTIDFFYYDMLRFRKISNLKSLTYLTDTINSNFVDRVDNQIYINQVYFFNPSAACLIQDTCFTGLQLCQNRDITAMTLTFSDPSCFVKTFYLTYSVDGRSYNCYQNCKVFSINQIKNSSFTMNFSDLKAQGVRIYPKSYQGKPTFSPTFFYN